jgi:hypothetical protein
MRLRLLVTDQCDRACPGCCNKQWDLSKLPIADQFNGYDEIMITGGEPLLDVVKTIAIITELHVATYAPIFVYTAKLEPASDVLAVLIMADGITVTLHEQNDFDKWLHLDDALAHFPDLFSDKSLRLNIFKNVKIPEGTDLSRWQVKDKIVWIDPCPLPNDEVFMQYGGKYA